MMRWLRRWRTQRNCFHHNRGIAGTPLEPGMAARTWINGRLINGGAGKMLMCHVCEKVWFV